MHTLLHRAQLLYITTYAGTASYTIRAIQRNFIHPKLDNNSRVVIGLKASDSQQSDKENQGWIPNFRIVIVSKI
ncbi:hypothetical protein OUZ56_016943 [Daphnia magna]|uniref:Uncharacterized protein n=1 Tax=Daphnia magna TaxID=35525 RepID=A0ABR0ARQ1_9CRUS|nr:hypothetical protein OUZ56_016943 [Daphnia magna]